MVSAEHRPAAGPVGERSERLRVLISGSADGDCEAFAGLYDEVSSVVYGTAVRVLRDEHHAAEVTQEVMLEVWQSASSFDERLGSVSAWVATIAHRRAVDRVRSVQAQRGRDQKVLDRTLDVPWDTVADEAEGRWERQQVRDCVDTLTPMQQEALQRTYYEGLTYRQAAERTQVALSTMKSRIRDALIGLRRCLGVDR